jgi:two-component system KDP operon response regulator KdpE
LLRAVWGPEYANETNYLRVHITHLRKKVEPDPSNPTYVATEPGLGYRFNAP